VVGEMIQVQDALLAMLGSTRQGVQAVVWLRQLALWCDASKDEQDG